MTSQPTAPATGTTLLRGGTVYSPVDPFATAMVLSGDRVAWVGQEGAAQAHVDGVDHVVDLDGALVTAGFVDAHIHLVQTATAVAAPDLSRARSARELLDLVAGAVQGSASAPSVVEAHGYDESTWGDPTLPSLEELDRAGAGLAVVLSRVDGHASLVSPALVASRPQIAAAGLDGALARGAAHREARTALQELITPAERQDRVRATLERCAAQGVVGVHENAAPHIGGLADVHAVLAVARDGAALPDVRTYWGELGADGVRTVLELGLAGAAGDLTIDGSIGSRTALFSQPYADDATRGHAYVDLDQATEHLLACTRAGVSGGFHCIGDTAVDIAVQALAGAAETEGVAAVQRARHRLEHVEAVTPEQAAMLSALGVAASVQPAFDAAWGGPDGMYVRRLGAARAATLNPFATLARAGVTLALGSDSPVTAASGWESVRAAATHHQPEHRMSVRGAFTAATRGGQRAGGIDDAGVLAPGMRASYVVWDVPGDLVVQAADERVSAWSTDPRSGVPGLPDLSAGSALPRARRTVRDGVLLHADDA